MRYCLILAGYFFYHGIALAQFTQEDSLRGSLNKNRSCFDVTYYHLTLKIDVAHQFISGNNKISFQAVTPFKQLQIDLFENLVVDSIIYLSKLSYFTHKGNVILITLPKQVNKGSNAQLTIFYHGRPTMALNPPWDGGFVWSNDSLGRPWVGVSCEGIGASLWWPNKDHLSDEPDSMQLSFEVPDTLYCVSNGNLINTAKKSEGYLNYDWMVHYPINNYNVTLNIGKYVSIQSKYLNKKDSFHLDYYVLDYHKALAEKHFKQVLPILNCFTDRFGSYPFAKDGYALVETSYLGMEHQGCIAYGNQFLNDVYDYDFIILHETAHEWWGNSVSVTDHGEMWIHEAFATYAEALFVENRYGKVRALEYLKMQKQKIKNTEPMLAPLGVNYKHWASADIYYKGTWMLHTLRNVINNDKVWFDYLLLLCTQFKRSSISTANVVQLLYKKTKIDYSYFFDQYLKYTTLPVLEYFFTTNKDVIQLHYRWQADVLDFKMPIRIKYDLKELLLKPISNWQQLAIDIKDKSSFMIKHDSYYCIEKNIR